MGAGPRAGFRWTRELIVYAIDLWHRAHLEAPTQDDWERAGPDHPCRLTVLREFGSWNAAISAAGLRPRPRGQNRRWARQRCALSGRWCTCNDGECVAGARVPLVTFYFEDFELGRRFELGTKTVTAEEIIRFGREFDPQPFHVDPDAAARSSFGGLVASGLHTFGVFSRLVTDAVMADAVNLGGAGIDEMRWLVPVYAGDTLSARATVFEGTRVSKTKLDRGILVLLAELTNQHGQLVWHARITSVIGRRP